MAIRRAERLSKEIVRLISEIILYELKDPRMGFITVTRAKLSGDLRNAKVYISILGEEKVKKLTMHGLNHARSFIQREVASRLCIRFAPIIEFALDGEDKQNGESISL